MDLGTSGRIGYEQARRLLVAVGLVVLAATAAVLYVRRVETTEVVAALLFVPIYLALVTGKLRGGVIAAVAASVVYAVLRLGGTDTLTTSEQVQLVAVRSAAYLVFGAVGGAAVRLLEASLSKLDRTDTIDDETGLYNARFLASELDLERVRAQRYGTSFAVVVVTSPVQGLRGLRRGPRAAALGAIGTSVRRDLRGMDRPGVVCDGDDLRMVVLLPETPREGARLVGERMVSRLDAVFASHALADTPFVLECQVFPEDDAAISALAARCERLEAHEHPHAARSVSAPA